MSNTFLTAHVIASRALATLYNKTVLAPLAYRNWEPEFQGKQGDTITVRTPATFVVNEFSQGGSITVQDVNEGSFDMTLDKHLDVSVAVTSRELTLNIDDFQTRVMDPIMSAYAQDIDSRVAVALAATATGTGGGGTVAIGAGDPNAVFRAARAKMTRANLMTAGDVFAVCSPEGLADALGDELLVTANKSGSTDALRNANIGDVFGFGTYESNQFGYGGGKKGQLDGVAFNRQAVSLATRTLALPKGADASRAAVVEFEGMGLRVVMDYDITHKTDVISVDLLCGVAGVPGRKQGAIGLDFGQGS